MEEEEGEGGLSHEPELIGLDDENRADEDEEAHDENRGAESGESPHPIVAECEGAGAKFARDNRGDQVAADHKEDVDTDVAPGGREPRVAEENAEDREGSEAVDVGPIGYFVTHVVWDCGDGESARMMAWSEGRLRSGREPRLIVMR